MVYASEDCTYVTQTRNIEKAGGALALIIDTDNEDVTDLVLADDGTGAGIRIPAMMINKYQGEILKQFLLSGSEDEIKATALKAEFLAEIASTNTVFTELWYTSSDDKSLDFIRNMAEYLEPIIDQITFEPKFVSWACPHCDSAYKNQNCISGGKYCALHHNADIEMDGKEILMEDLRQYCIFTQARESDDFLNLTHPINAFRKFDSYSIFLFEYVKLSHDICRNRITQDCSEITMKTLGIN